MYKPTFFADNETGYPSMGEAVLLIGIMISLAWCACKIKFRDREREIEDLEAQRIPPTRRHSFS